METVASSQLTKSQDALAERHRIDPPGPESQTVGGAEATREICGEQPFPSVQGGSPSRDKPQACYDCTCPLAHKAKKFVLDCGDPVSAKMAFLFEAPGGDEIAFELKPNPRRYLYSTKAECETEIALRYRDYPQLNGFIASGVPVVGPTWQELANWVLPRFGLHRRDLFIANVLHCLPPKGGKKEDGSPYPIGDERKRAEACCAQWSRLHLFKPSIAVVSLHPAGIIREVSPLPLQCKSIERAVSYMRAGERVLVLCGGKAAKWWLGYAENVQKWVGSYHWESNRLQQLRAERLRDGLTIDLTAKPKRRKKKESVDVPCAD